MATHAIARSSRSSHMDESLYKVQCTIIAIPLSVRNWTQKFYVCIYITSGLVIPSGCLVSGQPPASNYNNCKFSPLLALDMYNYAFCHFTHV